MAERIHDDEPDTGEGVVRALLSTECPQWADRPIEYLRSSGTDNAMWRVDVLDGSDVVVRLPRRPRAAANVAHEVAVLQAVERSPLRQLVATPRLRHVGEPHEVFAHRWIVLDWIGGSDAWTLRNDDAVSTATLADDLAAVVRAIGETDDVAVPERSAGERGGPLRPLVERLHGWLDDPSWRAADLIDVPAVRRLANEALDVADEPVQTGFAHGDLIPGNLLIDGGRLAAIIDWGGAGHADLAQDLAPAWSVLDRADRHRFKDAVGASEAAWIRGRAIELEHAVGGVLYYVPRRHPLGDVMSATLTRLLDDD